MSSYGPNSSSGSKKMKPRSSAYGSAGGSGPSQQQQLTADQRQEISEAFQLFDLDKDKRLSYHETKVALRALGFDLKKAEVVKLIRDAHGGLGRGDISASELWMNEEMFFVTLEQMMLARDPEEELRRAFKLFDEDGTGTISLKNLRRVAKDLGENISDQELQAMIDEFDLDGDNEISEAEFLDIMREGV